MVQDGPDGSLYLKLDERASRLVVLPGQDNGLLACGWLVASEGHFAKVRESFAKDGVTIVEGTPSGAAPRERRNGLLLHAHARRLLARVRRRRPRGMRLEQERPFRNHLGQRLGS